MAKRAEQPLAEEAGAAGDDEAFAAQLPKFGFRVAQDMVEVAWRKGEERFLGFAHRDEEKLGHVFKIEQDRAERDFAFWRGGAMHGSILGRSFTAVRRTERSRRGGTRRQKNPGPKGCGDFGLRLCCSSVKDRCGYSPSSRLGAAQNRLATQPCPILKTRPNTA
jgi:hypothetical protein